MPSTEILCGTAQSMTGSEVQVFFLNDVRGGAVELCNGKHFEQVALRPGRRVASEKSGEAGHRLRPYIVQVFLCRPMPLACRTISREHYLKV
jgi:hypothetical protein